MATHDPVALLRAVANRLEGEGRVLRDDLSVPEELYTKREALREALDSVAWSIRRAIEDVEKEVSATANTEAR